MTYCQSITQILRIIWVRCIPLSLRTKTRRRATPLLPFWIFSCRSGGTVSCALSFTTNVDDFNFHITNFPFLSSNFQSSSVCDVFISQLIRYVRACSSYECFIPRAARYMSGNVLNRPSGSFMVLWDLIKQYEVSLSQMLHDILGHDHIQ